MKRGAWLVLFWALVLPVALGGGKGRFAIFLHSGAETNEGRSRAAHALLYAEELAENGYEVVLVFDGAGTGWARVFQDPACPLHERYLKVLSLGVVEVICDHCAEESGVKQQLSERQRAVLASEYNGHASLVKWIEHGYRIIVL